MADKLHKPVIMLVPTGSIKIDDRYQRPVSLSQIKKIVNNFKPALFGVLELSRRDGSFTVFDGQHRLQAAKELGIISVPAVIHDDLNVEQEATLFSELQTERRSLMPMDRFKARLVAKEELAIKINEMLEKNNFEIARNKHEDDGNRIQAVTALERIETRYGIAHLDKTLQELRILWGTDPGVSQGKLIEGMALFLAGYGTNRRYTEDVKTRLRAVSPLVIVRRSTTIQHLSPPQAIFTTLRSIAKLWGPPREFKKP